MCSTVQSAGIRTVTCFFVVFALYSSILDLKWQLGLVTTLHPYWINMVGIVPLFVQRPPPHKLKSSYLEFLCHCCDMLMFMFMSRHFVVKACDCHHLYSCSLVFSKWNILSWTEVTWLDCHRSPLSVCQGPLFACFDLKLRPCIFKVTIPALDIQCGFELSDKLKFENLHFNVIVMVSLPICCAAEAKQPQNILLSEYFWTALCVF